MQNVKDYIFISCSTGVSVDESLDSSLLKTNDDILEELGHTNDLASSALPHPVLDPTPTPSLPSEMGSTMGDSVPPLGGGWACLQEAQLRTLTPLWETTSLGSPNPAIQQVGKMNLFYLILAFFLA